MMTSELQSVAGPYIVATRRNVLLGQLRKAISSRTFLRAQSLRGHTGRSFLLPVMKIPHPAIHQPAQLQDSY